MGIGLFQTSGEIIALSGSVGALLAFIFAGLVVFSVMRSLAEMASVRPVKGALMDYPHTFVDEALGFAVGIIYWSVSISPRSLLEMMTGINTDNRFRELQAGELHEHGHADHRCNDVYAILG